MLVAHIQEILDELASKLRQTPLTLESSKAHAHARFHAGFDAASLVHEYAALRIVLGHVFRELGAELSHDEWEPLAATLWYSAVVAVRSFTELRDEREARHKRALEQARAELEALYTAAPLGFAFLDRALRIRMVNPVLAEMNGLPREAHEGKTPMEVLPQAPADFFLTHARRVLETGQPEKNLEMVTATPATRGACRHYLEHWYPVRVNDEIVGIGVIVDDVTERRRAEALRDRIVAIVSHDLRNPISAILMTCAQLLARRPAPEIEGLIARVHRTASQMRSIVEQLFDYARLDTAGNLPLERTRFDLGELARRVIDETQLATSRPDVPVRLELHDDLRGEWDKARIGQVFSNLVGNALQHGTGGVVVRVAGLEREVTIDVANTGEPIAPDLLARIFEPFESATHGGRHLGLGLFITREIVRAHGGTIEARSGDGETVFSLRLPR